MENRSNSHDAVSEPSSDVKFIIDDVEIPANKKILSASSPYFRAMFEHFRERDQETVKMNDMSSESLKLIINYANTSEVQISEENVQDLLSTANLLECTDLCNACIHFLKGELHPMNCIGILNYAELHGFPSLYDEAKNIIYQNFIEVAKYQEFLNISLKEISQIISSDLLNVPEEKIFESVLIWVRHDLGVRHRHIISLIKSIRICCMPPSYINETLLTEPLLQIHPKLEDFVSEALEPFRAKGDPKTITDKCRQFRGSPKILLVVGGTQITCVEWFDFKKGTWCKMGDIPCRDFKKATVIVMDGQICISSSFGVHVYDPTTDKWNPGSNPGSSQPLSSVVAFSTSPNAVEGGTNGIVSDTGVIDCFKVAITSRRRDHEVGVVNGLLYAVGGRYRNTVYKSVLCYSPITKKSTYVQDNMHFARMGPGLGVLDGILYVVGGNDGVDALNSVEALDPTTGNWTMMSSMHKCRDGAAIIVINNLLYVIGGRDNKSDALDSMEVYDPATNIWTLLPNRMNVRRWHPMVAVIDMPNRL